MAIEVMGGSLEDILKELDRRQRAADTRVRPEQAALKPGDFFARQDRPTGILIYGEVLDPLAYYDTLGELDEDTLAEKTLEEAHWKDPSMQHVRFCRCYSPVVAEGEMGNVHVSTIDFFLGKDAFVIAKELGWPQDIGVLMDECRRRAVEHGGFL